MRPHRVAILHQGCIPTYRRAFYERLAKIPGREYVVFHGDPEPGSGIAAAEGPFLVPNVRVRNRFFTVLGRTVVYQSAIRTIMRGGFDVLVIGHEIKFIASMLLFLRFYLSGKPVIFWGHGRTPELLHRRALGRAVSRLAEGIKRRMIRGAAGYLAYTESTASYVIDAGMPPGRVSVLYNTIDISGEILTHAKASTLDRSTLRRELGLSEASTVVTFLGRLIAAKQPDLLIDAVQSLREKDGCNVELLIVGTGPAEDNIRARLRNVRWGQYLGSVRSDDRMSHIFRVTDAVVIPGLVGLVVTHAFAHGVPVITRRLPLQVPEIEYIKHGHNGLILDPKDFVRGLCEFVKSTELKERLAAGALETRKTLSMETMAATFDALIGRTIDLGQTDAR